MSELRPYQYWLANLSRNMLRSHDLNRLISTYGDESAVYGQRDYILSSLLGESKAAYIVAHRKKWDLFGEYEKFLKSGIHFITLDEPEFPSALKAIHDPPYGLFIKGRLPQPSKYCVGVIGARKCTQYGCNAAAALGASLADAGIQVISGLAYGIDSIAQKAALENNGAVFAVLGSGVDVCYPSANRRLYDGIMKEGGIISEFPPGAPPKALHFPLRNRIISAFSDTLAVVEAARKSGTAITVRLALEQGKDVYAVPGRIYDIESRGCNGLIQDGAGVITDIDDFIQGLKEHDRTKKIAPSSIKKSVKHETKAIPMKEIQMSLSDLPIKGLALSVYAAADSTLRSIDEILEMLGGNGIVTSFEEVCGALLELELMDYLVEESGCYRKRKYEKTS